MSEQELRLEILKTIHDVVSHAAEKVETECRTRGAKATSLQDPFLACEVAFLHFQRAILNEVHSRIPEPDPE